MATGDIVTLRVRGEDHTEWKRIDVTRSLDTFPAGFSLELATGTTAPAIRADDPCEILIGSDTVLTGYVSTIERSRSATERGYRVSGQSKVTDARCSCTGSPSEFLGLSIIQIATLLIEPYGLTLDADVTGVAQMERFVAEFGESVYEALERLCRPAGLVVTDNPAGELVLARLGTLRGSDLTPETVKTLRTRCSSGDRFSEYRVFGQTSGAGDVNFGADAAHPHATVEDPDVSRFRLLVLRAETQADIARCRDRATWEAVTRAGRAATCQVTVQGWRDGDEVLVPNRLRKLIYPEEGVDAELLVTEVSLKIGRDIGVIADLTLMPPGAFELLAPAEQPAQAHTRKKITAGLDDWGLDE